MLAIIKEKKQDDISTVFTCVWRTDIPITVKLPEPNKTEIDCLKYLLKIEEEIKDLDKNSIEIN